MKVSSVLAHRIREVACFYARKVANAWNQASLTLVDARDDFGTAGAISSVRTRFRKAEACSSETPRKERMATMSIEKKSLISNRAAVKKAMIASQPADATGDPKSLKSSTLAAHSMKKTKASAKFNLMAFKKAN
jgi:hypothetical protein